MKSNAKVDRTKKAAKSSYYDIDSAENERGRNDLWLLKYNINEKGIGKILLPPSLSTLLQSDRVSISPSAGGLFIRSVQISTSIKLPREVSK